MAPSPLPPRTLSPRTAPSSFPICWPMPAVWWSRISNGSRTWRMSDLADWCALNCLLRVFPICRCCLCSRTIFLVAQVLAIIRKCASWRIPTATCFSKLKSHSTGPYWYACVRVPLLPQRSCNASPEHKWIVYELTFAVKYCKMVNIGSIRTVSIFDSRQEKLWNSYFVLLWSKR